MPARSPNADDEDSFWAGIDYGRVRIGVALAHCKLRIALPHEKKGEQVILLCQGEPKDAKALAKFAKSKGAAEIMVPKTLISVDAIPLLGTGKVDFANAAKLGESLMPGRAEAVDEVA